MQQLLASTQLPFRDPNHHLFPRLPTFLSQFHYAKEFLDRTAVAEMRGCCSTTNLSVQLRRYLMYALQGPSQSAKTSFAKSLFTNPFVLTVQGVSTLNLSKFCYGKHDALSLPNMLGPKHVFQACLHVFLRFVSPQDLGQPERLGFHLGAPSRASEQSRLPQAWGIPNRGLFLFCALPWFGNFLEGHLSAKICFFLSVQVFLFAVPIMITLDLDVPSAAAFQASEWLRANVLLDTLQPGDTTYVPGERRMLPMAALPRLSLPA